MDKSDTILNQLPSAILKDNIKKYRRLFLFNELILL